MKVPQPELERFLKNEFIAMVGANRKLKRLWGTEIVNGIEVLQGRKLYYPASEIPANKKLFKFLGVYDQVSEFDGKGIEKAWFTLNKAKGYKDTTTDNSFVTQNLNRLWWDTNDGPKPENLTLTTSIVIGKSLGSANEAPNIDWTQDKEVIAQAIIDNYEALWESNHITQEGIGVINKGTYTDPLTNQQLPDEDDLSPDDPWLAILARYALRDSGIPCTIKDVAVGITALPDRHILNTAVVTLEIPEFVFTDSTPIVQAIALDIATPEEEFRSLKETRYFSGLGGSFYGHNVFITQALAKKVTFYEEEPDDNIETISRDYVTWAEYKDSVASEYDNFWVLKDKVYYLKADVIDNPKSYGINHKKLSRYLFSLLDTGYKKKPVPWYKKLIAFVLLVITVVIAYISYGTGSSVSSYITAAAYAILVGAAVISIAMLLSTALGAEEWASAFAHVSKQIQPLVMVATIIMVFNNVSTLIENAAETAAASGTTVAYEIATSVVESMFGDIISVAQGTASITTSTQFLTRLVSTYNKIQVKKLNSLNEKNKDLKAEYDKLAEETARESDIIRGYMNIYPKPATADWSMYASLFDLPYERSFGTLAIGNIQVTTKQAIRKADYDEPMFAGVFGT